MSDQVTVRSSGWEMDRRPVDVVVISSQVAYGSVGNTVSARVLTEAGHRCVQVPTIILGTLPHYPVLHGGPLPDDWFAGILDDLLTLGALSDVRYVLVGYLAHPGQAAIIASWFSRLRDTVPGVHLVVDPAMGDDDVGLYTDPAVAASYAEHLVPLATGLTPNRFELELLSSAAGSANAPALRTLESVYEAAARLARMPESWVVVTSATGGGDDSEQLTNALVTHDGTRSVFEHAKLATTAKGAGDIFAATVVATLLDGQNLSEAIGRGTDAVKNSIRALSAG